MRITTGLAATLLALAFVGGACSDDDTPVATGDPSGTTEPAADDDAGSGPADLRGTITSVEAFVPVTEDCTPPHDLDPDAPVSDEDPPVCTPDDNEVLGTILVEEQPAEADTGRKISFTVTEDSFIFGESADGEDVILFRDLAEGQLVQTWIAGDVCAESYPEQCGLDAISVTG